MQREPNDIRLIRICLQRWPLPRGKGILLGLFKKNLSNRQFLFEVEPGIVIPADPSDYIVRHYFADEYQSEPMVQLSRNLICAGDTVFDIGANIGLWTMGTALRAGSKSKIHAFEPFRRNFERLTTNLNLNNLKWVSCEQIAISDFVGTTVFYVPKANNSGLGSLGHRSGIDEWVDVPVTTLDAHCEKHRIRQVHFLKVDVEGAELKVFRGGQQLLADPSGPLIVFEVNEEMACRFGYTVRAIKLALQEYGYEIYRYHNGDLEVISSEEPHQNEDLFAIKPFHIARHKILRHMIQ